MTDGAKLRVRVDRVLVQRGLTVFPPWSSRLERRAEMIVDRIFFLFHLTQLLDLIFDPEKCHGSL